MKDLAGDITITIEGAAVIKKRTAGTEKVMCFEFADGYMGRIAHVFIGGDDGHKCDNMTSVKIKNPAMMITRKVGQGRLDWPSSRVRVTVPDDLKGTDVVVVIL